MSNFCRSELRQASKVHYCAWCGHPIVAEKYWHHSGVYDGDFYALKCHQKCNDQLDFTISREPYPEDLSIDDCRDIFRDYYENDWNKLNEIKEESKGS